MGHFRITQTRLPHFGELTRRNRLTPTESTHIHDIILQSVCKYTPTQAFSSWYHGEIHYYSGSRFILTRGPHSIGAWAFARCVAPIVIISVLCLFGIHRSFVSVVLNLDQADLLRSHTTGVAKVNLLSWKMKNINRDLSSHIRTASFSNKT